MTSIREAHITDATALGELHVQTWREAYWGVLPEEDVVHETPAERTRFWRSELTRIRRDRRRLDENVLLAEDEDKKVIGFAWVGAARGAPRAWEGEVYMLYVLQTAQRQGVGALLVEESAKHLVRRGFFRLGLWVLEENAIARGFYEALGGQQTGRRLKPLAGGPQVILGYLWDDPTLLLGEAPLD